MSTGISDNKNGEWPFFPFVVRITIHRIRILLLIKEHVSASTQNQALCALLFLYRHVLSRKVGDLGEVIRARKPKRLPVVMTREEVKAVLANLTGDKWLMASLMYGTGLRLMVACSGCRFFPE